ncbi:Tigger transposable element-derived protein 2, partial [Dictyocoela muelleri]
LDNATCHSITEKFSNIEIIFIPKNTTSLIQPLDQRIIKSFKDKYKTLLVSSFLFSTDVNDNYDKILKNITVLDAISISSLAWAGITDETIKNCFKKALSYDKKNIKKPASFFENEINNEVKINDDLIKNIITTTVEEFQQELSEENNNQEHNKFEYSNTIHEDLIEIEKNFKDLLSSIKKLCPEEILDLYKFKLEIIKKIKFKNEISTNIMDFLIKNKF